MVVRTSLATPLAVVSPTKTTTSGVARLKGFRGIESTLAGLAG